MTSKDNKRKENGDAQGQDEQRRRRRPDALSLLSSLLSSDDPNDASTPNVTSQIPLSLTRLQSQPLSLGLIRERDASVRKTLSQDWLKERFSPRPRSVERPPFATKGSWHSSAGPLFSKLSLASIAEDDHDDDSDVSGDLGPVVAHEISDKTRALSISQAVSRPREGEEEERSPKVQARFSGIE